MIENSAFRGTTCRSSGDWLLRVIDDTRSSLKNRIRDDISLHTAANIPTVMQLLEAAYTADVGRALEIGRNCNSGEAFDRIAIAAIEQLDREWQLDRRGLVRISTAFWTIRRVLEQRSYQTPPRTSRSANSPNIVLYVPPNEQHSFGAQLLADQMAREGFCVELLLGRPATVLYDSLANHRCDLLGISLGYDEALLGMADLISKARLESANPAMSVAVGGQVFVSDITNYSFLGADVVLTAGEDPVVRLREQLLPSSVYGDVG